MKKTPTQIPIRTWRLVLVGGSLVTLVVALGVRIAMLQVVPEYERGYQFLQQQGDARTVRDIVIPASRGMILDRNGKPLAVSTPVISVWADPREVNLSDTQFSELSEILDMPVTRLRERLSYEDGKRFVYLSRGLEPSFEARLSPLAAGGIYTLQEYRRYYPAAEMAAQVIGVTDIDDHGQEGIELGFDAWLSGTPGLQRVIRDLQGRVVDSAQVLSPAEPGNDIWLTLDSRLQFLAYRELKSAVAVHQASSGSVVILDVHSGDILAMVNQPSVNPNSRRNLTANALRNRAIADIFEPGSTVKPFTMLAALESGRYTPESIVDTSPGRLMVQGKPEPVYDPVNYGRLSLTQVLAKSSQVGTTMVALQLDPERMRDTLVRVGMGDLPGTGIPGEVSGSLPQRYEWRPIEQATLGYGYGLSVTALQLAQAYATLANGGYRVSPRIFRDAVPMAPVRTAESELIDQVRTMMEAVIAPGGTGHNAAVPGYRVAGKTGTVHMVGSGGYDEHRYSAIFAGFAPAPTPEIAIVVMVSDPQSDEYSGGLVAAPVFGSIAGEALRLLGIPSEPEQRTLLTAVGFNP